MKNLKELLIASIVLIVIGLLGLSMSFLIGGIGMGLSNFSTAQSYKYNNQDFCNRRSGNILSIKGNNLSFETVRDLSQDYIARFGQDLKIAEIMEFSKNYYIEVVEEDTGIGAMELLVDKSTGYIFPEYGPNMMWNLKYGMHSRMKSTDAAVMPIDEEKAIEIAESYLAKSDFNEYVAGEAKRFYGYYTMHTIDKNGNILGMLSVNGFSGAVWYHGWHGVFIDMTEEH